MLKTFGGIKWYKVVKVIYFYVTYVVDRIECPI